MEYTLIYSDRKSISASIKEGKLTVRAPKRIPQSMIDEFLKKHKKWIEKHTVASVKESEKINSIPAEDVPRIKAEARKYFEEKTAYYSNIMGLKYGRITITSAKTRFGSCSSKGRISYSYRLMLYPEAARDYVVVHELAHLVEMNHSKRFYDVIEKFMPDYKERKRMLK